MRRPVTLLLVLVLAVRSLLPAGYMLMPSPAGDGTVSVVICTGHGPETITLDSDGNPVKPKPAKSDNGLCPYAASTPVAVAAAEPIVVGSQPNFAAVAYLAAADLICADRLAGSTSARGPPVLQS